MDDNHLELIEKVHRRKPTTTKVILILNFVIAGLLLGFLVAAFVLHINDDHAARYADLALSTLFFLSLVTLTVAEYLEDRRVDNLVEEYIKKNKK